MNQTSDSVDVILIAKAANIVRYIVKEHAMPKRGVWLISLLLSCDFEVGEEK